MLSIRNANRHVVEDKRIAEIIKAKDIILLQVQNRRLNQNVSEQSAWLLQLKNINKLAYLRKLISAAQ